MKADQGISTFLRGDSVFTKKSHKNMCLYMRHLARSMVCMDCFFIDVIQHRKEN